MADCSTVEEAVHADALGFDFIGTTMVGYTKQSEGDKIEENDFEPSTMLKYYSSEEEKEYGVVGVEIALLSD